MDEIPDRSSTGSRFRAFASSLGRDPVRLSFAALLVLLTALYVEHGGPLGGDGHYYFLHVRSWVMDGDLDMEDDYRRFGNPWRFERVPETGRLPNWYAIGPAILWTPFYLTAHAVVVAAVALGADVPQDGYSGPYQGITFYGSVVFAFLALLAAYRVAARFVSRPAAAGAVWAIALGSPLFYFSLYATSYSHAASALAVAVFFLHWVQTRDEPQGRRWALSGLLCGVAGLMRAQNLVLAAIPAVAWTAGAVRGVRAQGRRAAGPWLLAGGAFAGAMVVGFLPQLLVWRYYYGTMTRLLLHSWFMHWGDPFVWEVLFSSRNGLFPWTPLLYASVAGLAVLVRRDARAGLAALAAFALQTYVNASAWPWWAGFSFGQRRFLGVTIWFVVGTALVIQRGGAWLRGRGVVRRVTASFLALFMVGACALNVSLAWRVKTHRLGTAVPVRMLDVYGEPLRSLLSPLEPAIGNPFSFPAPLYYWGRYGIPPADFDLVVGHYFAYRDSMGPRETREVLRMSAPGVRPFLKGFWVERTAARIQPPCGTLFLPLYLPQAYLFESEVTGSPDGTGLAIRVNAEEIATSATPGARTTRIGFRAGREVLRSGINRIEFCTQRPDIAVLALRIQTTESGP